jgi:hypothetical protein
VSASSALSDDVRRFVLTNIPSVPYLEAVLLFQRAGVEGLTAAETAHALYVDAAAAAALLAALAQNGIVAARDARWVYAPRDERLAGVLQDVAQAYRQDLVGVTSLIHRRTGAERFADAFRWRQER